MHLFDPITLRGATLPNRIVVSPMCQYSADAGCATDWHLIHWGQMLLSGAGMFTIEATAVSAEGRITPGCLGLYDDATESALATTLARARRQAPPMPVAIQLAHAGRKGSSARPWEGGLLVSPERGGWTPVAPSAVPHAEGESAPIALDAAGLAALRAAFVASARRAERCGIDAIELHMAHGYLLHQFLSPLANRRDDAYGGPFDNRVRFPLEVFDAVRAAGRPLGRWACACRRPTGSKAAGLRKMPSSSRDGSRRAAATGWTCRAAVFRRHSEYRRRPRASTCPLRGRSGARPES